MDQSGDLGTQLLHQYGYAGLIVGLLCGTMGIPVSSEILLPLSAAAAHTGGLNIVWVGIIALAAQMTGLVVSYFIGRHGGFALLERYGHFIFLNHARLNKLHRLFKRHGLRLVLAGLYLPGMHGYMGYVAGLGLMSFPLFAALAFVNVVIWSAVFMGAGLLLSNHIDQFGQITTEIGVGIGLVFLVVAAIWYSKHHAHR